MRADLDRIANLIERGSLGTPEARALRDRADPATVDRVLRLADAREAAAKLPLRTPERIAIAGDWHGNTEWALRMVDVAACEHVEVILHLGDFGYRSNAPDYLDELDWELCRNDVRLLWIDGNHDDHDALADLLPDEESGGLHFVRHSIWHLPRGFRWQWLGKTWLALGGAASIDRKARTPGYDWWPGEMITQTDIDAATAGGRADIMLTHDCPAGVDLPGHDVTTSMPWPLTDYAASVHNRMALRSVLEDVRPKVLFHGHHHARYTGKLNAPDFTTHIEGMDCDGAAETDNMLIMNLENLLP